MRLFACAAAIALACAPVRAQEGQYGINHAEHHAWYDSLRNARTGVSCCHSADCRPTSARRKAGQWYAKVDGAWRHIPQRVILPDTAPDGQAHICSNPDGSHLYCFIRPFFGM